MSTAPGERTSITLCTRAAVATIAVFGLLSACAAMPPAADLPGLDGTDGCNRYAVPYTATGSKLKFEPTGVSTQMACPQEVMEQAGAFMASLGGARSFRVDAGQLQLQAGGGALLAGLAPQPQGPAGRVSGSAGCNNYTGTYVSNGSTLAFGPAATTRKMCVEPARIMEQEQQSLKALESVATARQEGDRLELRTADGALAVSLTRESAQ